MGVTLQSLHDLVGVEAVVGLGGGHGGGDTGCDEGYAHSSAPSRVLNDSEYDVRLRLAGILDDASDLMHLADGKIAASSDVE